MSVHGEIVGRIDEPGLLVFIAATHCDTQQTARILAAKIWHLRILEGEVSCATTDSPILVVSQFTLYADTTKGRRPSWSKAAPASVSEPLVQTFNNALTGLGARVETGQFGADMEVELANHGPLTLLLDTED